MLEIVFLGTGSGVPSIKRNHSAISLLYEGEHLLWDCGEGTQRQLLIAKLNFMKIDHIFITHWHADHWAGLISIFQTMNLEKRKAPLHVYGPDAERFIHDLLDLDYWGPRFRIVPKNVPYEGSEETLVLEKKDFTIHSIPVSHTVPAVAYCFKERDSWNVDIKKAELFGLRQSPLIGKLKKDKEIVFKGKKIALKDVANMNRGVKVVYSGDTKACSNLLTLAKDADILIHDATFLEEKEDRMHTGAREAGQLAKEANVKTLVLTHFSRRYMDVTPLEEEAKKVFPNTITARDFLRLRVQKEK